MSATNAMNGGGPGGRAFGTVVVSAFCAWAAGCATTPPPRELVDARRVQQEGERGSVSKVAPVELEEAREALVRAERAYEADPDEEYTRDLAYVALRKGERAQSRGAAEVARQRVGENLRQQEELEAEYLRRTQRQLTVTQQQLEEERQRLAASHQALEQSQVQLAERQQALETERAARERAERETAAALESLRQVAQVQEEQRGVVITLSGAVLFASGQNELLPIARQKLDQVAATLKDHSGRPILVEGHTDSQGSDRANMELSDRRARAVRDYLVSQGVDANTIRAAGLGETRPIGANTNPEGRAENRRVEIIIEPARQ